MHDLGDMTYREVALRIVHLTYVAYQDRWVDITLLNLTGDWLRHVEEVEGVWYCGYATVS